jgi:hypothetical protein
VETVLDELLVSREVDATVMLAVDPVELLERRLREKLSLSRYGRIDPFAWEQRDINELRAYYGQLVELLKLEHPATTGEDR